MSLTSEEEAVLLGNELEPQEAQEVTMSSLECPKTPELEEPTEGSDTTKSTCPFVHGLRLPGLPDLEYQESPA